MRLLKQAVTIMMIVSLVVTSLCACSKEQKQASNQEVEQTADEGTKEETEIADEKTEDSEEKSNEEAKPVDIRIVTMFGGTDPAASVYQDALKEYMDKHPNVTIKDESATADDAWKQRVSVDFSAGNEPDITFYFAGVDQNAMVENNKVVSIDTIRQDYDDYASNINDGPFDMVKANDGKVYCVPVTGFYEGLICNKDMFDKYNLQLPTDWTKLETAVKTFKENDVVPFSVAIGHIPNYFIEHLILAVGGVDGHKAELNETIPETWIKGLNYFKEFNDLGAFPVDTLTVNESITSQMFLDKKAAMQLDGSWFLGRVEDTENTVFLPFPCAPEGQKDDSSLIAGFSSGYFISTNAYNNKSKRDTVVDLVEFLTTDEMIGKFAAANGGMPAASVEIPSDNAMRKSASKVLAQAEKLDAPIDMRLSKSAWNTLLDGVPYLLDGSKTSEELLKEVLVENQD